MWSRVGVLNWCMCKNCKEESRDGCTLRFVLLDNCFLGKEFLLYANTVGIASFFNNHFGWFTREVRSKHVTKWMKVKSVKLKPTSVACHTCSLDAINKRYKRKLQNKKTKINEKLDTHRNKICYVFRINLVYFFWILKTYEKNIKKH